MEKFAPRCITIMLAIAQSNMTRMLIFLLIAVLGVVAMMALFAVGCEIWNDDYPHKIQYGLFPFWQIVDDGPLSGYRSSHILYTGLVETALAAAGIILLVYLAWTRLMDASPPRNHSTLPFELE
jgi:hypothetical protein